MASPRTSGSKYLTPAEHAAVVAYIEQRAAYLEDSFGKTPPNSKVLAVWPRDSDIKEVRLVAAPWGGQQLAAIRFHHHLAERPRLLSLGLWAACILAIGSGMSADLKGNKKGGGLLYPALKPYKAQFYLQRLLKDPAPSQRVGSFTLDDIPTDHHYITHQTLKVTGVDKTGKDNLPKKSPKLARPQFYMEAERHFAENQKQAGFEMTKEGYVRALKLAFELDDREHAMRSAPPAAEAAE